MSSHLFDEFVDPVSPPAAYIGGKRRLAGRIRRAIDGIPHEIYVEPFVGMGGVFLRRTRKPRSEVINDISEDVTTLFRILQRHYVAFLDMLRFQLTTRSGFERLLRIDPSTLTDLERAARFLYLQRLSFGGQVSKRNFGIDPVSSAGFDVTKLGPLLEAVHERLAGVVIERLPWDELITRYDRPQTLFYLDPPYFGCESDYGPGVFDRADFTKMADRLAAIDGQFLLSLNDTPEVRAIFSAFAQAPVSLFYSVGGGDKTVEASELVISSIDRERLEQLLPSSQSVQ